LLFRSTKDFQAPPPKKKNKTNKENKAKYKKGSDA
jgi:hypothetical protein